MRHALNKVSETAGAANFTVGYSDGAYTLLASDRRVDAVMLESLIQEQKDLDLIPKLVTGLLAHRKAGRWLVDSMKGQSGDVNIVELQSTVGSAPAIDRKKGFEEVIKADPRFKIIRSQTGDFTRAKGKEVMEAFLKAEGKKINVLYAHNDDMAIGAIQAIEEAGLKPAKDIVIVSIDAVKGAFEAMIAGKLNVSIECSPLLGPQLMQAVKDLKGGKALPKRIVTQEGIFPMEVAAKEFPSRKY